ncbi:MAG: 4-hydroxyphenylacetate 3-hydroxylase C-terminal domain-containing protein, partial [Thermodesulfobacteriota bacterium]|nr:4-hydroxyphenylacetate 3-hydroxylase C-terminal domain-containing protein [Thermodesulfobacteriota bacterium]
MENNKSRLISFADLKNFCKQVYQRVGVPDDEADIVADLPSDRDFENPEIGELLKKYLKGATGVPVEKRIKMLRLV